MFTRTYLERRPGLPHSRRFQLLRDRLAMSFGVQIHASLQCQRRVESSRASLWGGPLRAWQLPERPHRPNLRCTRGQRFLRLRLWVVPEAGTRARGHREPSCDDWFNFSAANATERRTIDFLGVRELCSRSRLGTLSNAKCVIRDIARRDVFRSLCVTRRANIGSVLTTSEQRHRGGTQISAIGGASQKDISSCAPLDSRRAPVAGPRGLHRRTRTVQKSNDRALLHRRSIALP